jgi:hypothetical protein
MNYKSLFFVNKKELINTLNLLSIALPKIKKYALEISLEMTITDGKVDFTIPGASFSINAETKGTCKASLRFLHFLELVKSSNNDNVEVVIEKNLLKVGKVSVGVQSTFFKNDRILRSIDLPINYKLVDIIRLPQNGYTWEEIEFNNLVTTYNHAYAEYEKNVKAAAKLLSPFGITEKALTDFVKKNVFKDN